eukprot:sb/3479460/
MNVLGLVALVVLGVCQTIAQIPPPPDHLSGFYTLVDVEGNVITPEFRGEHSGLLLYKDETVCGDGFDELAADLICQDMGYTSHLSFSKGLNWPDQQSSREIGLYEIDCEEGAETESECWKLTSEDDVFSPCVHSNDVFLECSTAVFSSCRPGSVRNDFGLCVMCRAGMKQVGDVCEPCPEGQYSDEGATECVARPIIPTASPVVNPSEEVDEPVEETSKETVEEVNKEKVENGTEVVDYVPPVESATEVIDEPKVNHNWRSDNFFYSVSIGKGVEYKWSFFERPLFIFTSKPITGTSQIHFELSSARDNYITDVLFKMNPERPSLTLSSCKEIEGGTVYLERMDADHHYNSVGNNYFEFAKDASFLNVSIGNQWIGSFKFGNFADCGPPLGWDIASRSRMTVVFTEEDNMSDAFVETVCPLGVEMNEDGTCPPCPLGQFLAVGGICLQCPIGATTRTPNAISIGECICPNGEQLDKNGECPVECEVGSIYDAATGECILLSTIPPEEKGPEEKDEEVPEEIEEVVNNGKVTFSNRTRVNETTGEEITIQVWKPDLRGSTLPVNKLVKKSTEYMTNMTGDNVFGYLTYNGFTATGLNERKKNEEEGVSVKKIDQKSMDLILKSYQKFSGFPETGELLNEELEGMNVVTCGSPDTNVFSETNVKTCHQLKQKLYDSGRDDHCVSDSHQRLKLCVRIPEGGPDLFTQNTTYYIELDADYNIRDYQYNNHIGVAFNHDPVSHEADYVLLINEVKRKRHCFHYGRYSDASRARLGAGGCMGYKYSQYVTQQFKYRVTVGRENGDVDVYINNNRAMTFEATSKFSTNVFLFTLNGRRFTKNVFSLFTVRVCQFNKPAEIERAGEEEEDWEEGSEEVWEQENDDLEGSGSRRRKRAISKNKWFPDNTEITFSFTNYSTTLVPGKTRKQNNKIPIRIGKEDTISEVTKALEVYAKTKKLSFKENRSRPNDAQIVFMFIDGKHADGLTFDGAGAEKGHAWSPVHGEVHFNDNQKFSLDPNSHDGRAVCLFFVAMHEIGHALGLTHSVIKNAVMNAGYSDSAFTITDLDKEDKQNVDTQYSDQSPPSPSVSMDDDPENVDEEPYIPRMPLPKSCHDRIEAAFYFYGEYV